MARIRSIKPEFWDDEKLAMQTSRDARLLFIGLWNFADDFGIVKGNPVWLKNKIFPYEDIPKNQITLWLKKLTAVFSIIPFTANNEQFYFIRNFSKHQVINKPSKSLRNPTPPDNILESVPESYRSTTGALPEEYAEEGKGREGKGEEGKGGDNKKSSFSKDFKLTDDLRKYCSQYNINDADAFYEHFVMTCEANGYKYKSWNLAFQNWVRDPKSDRFREEPEWVPPEERGE